MGTMIPIVWVRNRDFDWLCDLLNSRLCALDTGLNPARGALLITTALFCILSDLSKVLPLECDYVGLLGRGLLENSGRVLVASQQTLCNKTYLCCKVCSPRFWHLLIWFHSGVTRYPGLFASTSFVHVHF